MNAYATNIAARHDFHHQLSTTLIRDNQAVAVEDLAVKGLARTRVAKSVHDAGWAAFVAMLEYKARLYGREFHRIGRFVPTSQTCSACGLNVAKAAGLAVTACRAQIRPEPALARRGEAGTHPKSRQEAT